MAKKPKKPKKPVKLPKGYVPSEDEKFMNAKQKEYFRRKLSDWKADIAEETRNTVEYLKGESVSHPDPCLLYTSPSPRDRTRSRMPSSA